MVSCFMCSMKAADLCLLASIALATFVTTVHCAWRFTDDLYIR